MANKIPFLTSFIVLALLAILAACLRLGFVTNNFQPFNALAGFTSTFIMLIGVWYLIAPPHRSVPRKSRK